MGGSKRLWSEIKTGLSELADHQTDLNSELSKDKLRDIHRAAAIESHARDLRTIRSNPINLKKFFLNGAHLTPEKIAPRLILANNIDEYEDLFKASTIFWSVPVSRGYGRRMRFLVYDDYHESVVGIIGLMDPVFNLAARDQWIGWNLKQKYKRLKSVMDCYILGAVPPYNSILGGKLIVSIGFSRELRHLFQKRYLGKVSEISHARHDGKLALLTVTSALGRSSIYNRVALPWGQRCRSIGYTSGYGVFHVPTDLFLKIKEALEIDDHPYARAYKFGQGPSWKMRVLRYAMGRVGLEHLLNHGIHREVFGLELGHNTRRFLNGKALRHLGYSSSVEQITTYWKERWSLPRAARDQTYSRIDGAELYFERLSSTIDAVQEKQFETNYNADRLDEIK